MLILILVEHLSESFMSILHKPGFVHLKEKSYATCLSHVAWIMDSCNSRVSHGLKAGEEKKAGDVCGAEQAGQLDR